jgi:hypothetical protein
MSDTLAAPAPSGTVTAPVTPEPPKSIAEANKAVRAMGDSWENVSLAPPAEGMGVTDGAEDDAPATPVAPVAEAAPPTSDDAPEFVQDDTGRWHRADGTMANADEIAAISAQLASETPSVEAPVAEAPATENVVTLRRRDGSTRDVIIEDPELAQEIRQNMNDGMRRREFLEAKASIEAREAQLKQIDAMLEHNPEAVVYQSLNDDQKIRLTQLLVAEHWDAIVPIINAFAENPSERITTTTEAQARMRQQNTQLQSFTAAQESAANVRKAVAALIPETAEQDIAEQFWSDASNDVQRAIARGEKVDPASVATILAPRLKLYGFATAGSAPAAAAMPRITLASPAPSSSPAAQPANDAAKQLADAKAAQKRIRLRQQQRTNAAAVPPAGAGAAPVRMPAVPAGSTIQEASKQLRKMGGGWAQIGNH